MLRAAARRAQEAAHPCAGGCPSMCRRLPIHVQEAAHPCAGGCPSVCRRLPIRVQEAAYSEGRPPVRVPARASRLLEAKGPTCRFWDPWPPREMPAASAECAIPPVRIARHSGRPFSLSAPNGLPSVFPAKPAVISWPGRQPCREQVGPSAARLSPEGHREWGELPTAAVMPFSPERRSDGAHNRELETHAV
jgi:hypothetical protein